MLRNKPVTSQFVNGNAQGMVGTSLGSSSRPMASQQGQFNSKRKRSYSKGINKSDNGGEGKGYHQGRGNASQRHGYYHNSKKHYGVGYQGSKVSNINVPPPQAVAPSASAPLKMESTAGGSAGGLDAVATPQELNLELPGKSLYKELPLTDYLGEINVIWLKRSRYGAHSSLQAYVTPVDSDMDVVRSRTAQVAGDKYATVRIKSQLELSKIRKDRVMLFKHSKGTQWYRVTCFNEVMTNAKTDKACLFFVDVGQRQELPYSVNELRVIVDPTAYSYVTAIPRQAQEYFVDGIQIFPHQTKYVKNLEDLLMGKTFKIYAFYPATPSYRIFADLKLVRKKKQNGTDTFIEESMRKKILDLEYGTSSVNYGRYPCISKTQSEVLFGQRLVPTDCTPGPEPSVSKFNSPLKIFQSISAIVPAGSSSPGAPSVLTDAPVWMDATAERQWLSTNYGGDKQSLSVSLSRLPTSSSSVTLKKTGADSDSGSSCWSVIEEDGKDEKEKKYEQLKGKVMGGNVNKPRGKSESFKKGIVKEVVKSGKMKTSDQQDKTQELRDSSSTELELGLKYWDYPTPDFYEYLLKAA